jgi:hypothetical protein
MISLNMQETLGNSGYLWYRSQESGWQFARRYRDRSGSRTVAGIDYVVEEAGDSSPLGIFLHSCAV